MTPGEEAGARLLAETYERWATMPKLAFAVSREQLFTLVMACQGMISHPAVPPLMAQSMENLGRQFQEAICDTAELYTMIETGWHRALDVDPEADR